MIINHLLVDVQYQSNKEHFNDFVSVVFVNRTHLMRSYDFQMMQDVIKKLQAKRLESEIIVE